MAITGRTHNDANIDIADLAAVRASVEQANAVGHWRRVLAIYGDHLPTCAARDGDACNCGWTEAFGT